MKTLLHLLLLIALCSLLAEAQIPRTLSYQGVLTDISGKPRSDSTYNFTFSLYDSGSGGQLLWTEAKSLPTKHGLFSTALGDVTPFPDSLRFDRPYWLDIAVGGIGELSPRIQLTSVGYSMNSLRADTSKVAMTSIENSGWVKIDSNIIFPFIQTGRVGIGRTNPAAKLHVNSWGPSAPPQLRLENSWRTSDVWDFAINDNGTMPYLGIAVRGSNAISIIPTGNVGIGTNTPTATLDVGGLTKTQVLEITGGSDLAEPFEITNEESLPAGTVVVIDQDNAGKLRQSTQQYDKRVAGIISGAGGINPGLTLNQQDNFKGGQHVALSGKVYVRATTANGQIEPGDLLTTSDVAGHAMKATDKEKSFGTIIGKAMSSLKEGEGLVLVLVNLQ